MLVGRRDQCGDVIDHAVGAERHAGGDRLAKGEEVRLETKLGRESTECGHQRVRLIDRQQRPRVARELSERLMEPWFGRHDADVRHRGLREDEGDVPRRECALERVDVVELHDARMIRHRSRQALLLGKNRPFLQHHKGCVAVAVVLPVEHQDDLAAGRAPCEADHLGIRLCRRQCELPLRHAVSRSQVLGNGDRVGAREKELVADGDPALDGFDHRAGRMTAEPAHVGDVHVEVAVAVDIGERGTLAALHHDRGVLIEVVHPDHRYAPWHRAARSLEQLHGTRALRDEPCILLSLELRDQLDADARQVRHGAHAAMSPGRKRTARFESDPRQ
jgi:hypothetical protein